MILSTNQKRLRQEKVLSLKDAGQKRKMVVKIELTLPPDCNILPFFKWF